MKRLFKIAGGLLLAGLAYLCLWPVSVVPVRWVAPAPPGYQGPFAVNQRLAHLQMIGLDGEQGPEQITMGPANKLYTTVASGNILRMNPDGTALEVFAHTGGRVLGFDFDAAGNLIAADAYLGLLSISPDKKISVLSDQFGGQPIRYADAVVVARKGPFAGRIYFTDASARFGPKEFGGTFEASVLDILEQSSTGRLLEYNPATQSTRVVARGIAFANGIALSSDEESLLVAETGKYRIWKIAADAQQIDLLAAPLAPSQARVLLDNLPGYPDNLMRGQDGRIWAGLVKPRNRVVDALADWPFLRQITLRLPRALWPIPPAYGHVFAFTDEGRIVADLQDPSGAYPETTGATETTQRLYIQSLHAKGIGWLAKR